MLMIDEFVGRGEMALQHMHGMTLASRMYDMWCSAQLPGLWSSVLLHFLTLLSSAQTTDLPLAYSTLHSSCPCHSTSSHRALPRHKERGCVSSKMMCFKHLMLFSLLLPVPVSHLLHAPHWLWSTDHQTASPIFLALFSMAVFWYVRPCGYCLAIVSPESPSSPLGLHLQERLTGSSSPCS